MGNGSHVSAYVGRRIGFEWKLMVLVFGKSWLKVQQWLNLRLEPCHDR